MAQLKGIARNLNQLTRSAHVGGFAAVVASHAAIITGIEEFLKLLRHDR
ncbi:plasmid mobilization relaxosome protein MobC [Alistipes sp.]